MDKILFVANTTGKLHKSVLAVNSDYFFIFKSCMYSVCAYVLLFGYKCKSETVVKTFAKHF